MNELIANAVTAVDMRTAIERAIADTQDLPCNDRTKDLYSRLMACSLIATEIGREFVDKAHSARLKAAALRMGEKNQTV